MNGHAPRGGCIGVNGEFYEGGKFLPSNPNRPRGMSTNYGTKKCEIAPYVWDTYKGKLKPDRKMDAFLNGHSILNKAQKILLSA